MFISLIQSTVGAAPQSPRQRIGSLRFAVVLLPVVLCACSEPMGLRSEPCDEPIFTVLPVEEANIQSISVVGGIDAPGHVLPTPHSGIILTRAGAPVRAPGDLQITVLRRARYLTSANRQGVADFALDFRVCRDVTGWFGHLTTLSAAIPTADINWRNCETYSTPFETVEACRATPGNLIVSAGTELGTAGLSPQQNQMSLDFGLLDDRVTNVYITPQRYPPPTLHAVCAWERFDAASQAILFSKLRDRGPGLMPRGEPRCGTMQVDVAGTAKGVWAEPGSPAQVGGDERSFITLANYPYRPQEYLALSLGPASLGAVLATVPRQTSGRVNRAFEQVSADGLLYCYTDPGTVSSWMLSLSAAGTLTMARRVHAPGASPCFTDPATWTLGAGAVTLVR